MALLYAEGFDLFDNTQDVFSSGPITGNASPTFGAATGRFGGGGITNASGFSTSGPHFPFLAAVGDTVYFGFAFKYVGTEVRTGSFATIVGHPSTALVTLNLSPSGHIWVAGNSGAYHPTGDVEGLTPNCWHWVEMSVTFGTNGTTGAIELRIDGITYLTASGIDTFGTSSTHPARLTFNGNEGGYVIDDALIWSASGDAPNTWIDGARIVTLRPTADGAVVDWTANTGADYAAVDDPNGSNDGDSTYIASATATQRSRFAMEDLPNAGDSIYGVQVRARAKKTGTQPRIIQGYVRSNTSETDTDSIYLTTDYVAHRCSPVAVNPDGGGAWDKAAVDAMEVGVELVS